MNSAIKISWIICLFLLCYSNSGLAQNSPNQGNYAQPKLPVTKQNDTFDNDIVDEQPEFPGGMEAYSRYLASHIKYNQQSLDTHGTIYVSAIITKEGKIKNAKIIKDIPGTNLGVEVLRAVNAMPDWKPGKINGKTVNVRYTFLPIKFVLH